MLNLKTVNQQPKEGIVHREDGMLEVHSIFKTIQGEGPFAGHPAIFVRLAGCVLDCPACDTDYTSSRELLAPLEILERVEEVMRDDKIRLIVLTGGEPFRQNIKPFVQLALGEYSVQIETNGTIYQNLPYSHMLLSIVCSPKTPRLNRRLLAHVVSYKYILQEGFVDEKDGLPTRTMGMNTPVARPGDPPYRVYLQPLDEGDPEKNKRNTEAAIKSCMKFGYILSLQQHKVLGLE